MNPVAAGQEGAYEPNAEVIDPARRRRTGLGVTATGDSENEAPGTQRLTMKKGPRMQIAGRRGARWESGQEIF